jgi:hypothetical protein
VPNFGQDKDILENYAHLSGAEDSLKHKWVVTAADLKKEAFKDYRVPNFGLDHDVVRTQSHIAESETKLGNAKWNPQPFLNEPANEMMQVNVQSDDDSSDSDNEDV